MKIYIIRHGLSTANEERRYSGTQDVSLSESGIQELIQIKDEFKWMNGLPVYTSTLRRTRQTAEILFPDSLIIENLSFMSEMDFGEFEGKTYEELKDNKNYQSFFDDVRQYQPITGESFNQFKHRVINGFIQHRKSLIEDSIYVTHGGVIRLIMSEFIDTSIPFFDWSIDNGRGYEITIENDRVTTYKKV